MSKIRSSFVSNSSSSSFLIDIGCLSEKQIQLIHDHVNHVEHSWDKWTIKDNGNELNIRTSMDNFDMHYYLLDVVGIREEDIIQEGW